MNKVRRTLTPWPWRVACWDGQDRLLGHCWARATSAEGACAAVARQGRFLVHVRRAKRFSATAAPRETVRAG